MENRKREEKVTGAALVLEGGGMRGLYTAGVLDFLLDQGLHFDYVIGVSAGASHALSYISRQRGRARRVNVDYCSRPDYMGLRCLIREGSLFGMDLLFKKIPYCYDLYDFAAFERNVGDFTVVVTDLRTGRPEYLKPRSADAVLGAAQASCSLPLVSQPVQLDGRPYLDGGIADSIPAKKALEDGNRKVVVVLTQPAGFRKGPTRHRFLFRACYRKHREFARALVTRNERYDETLAYIEALEAEGKALVLRPRPQPGLNRLERNPEVLDGLYRSGYEDAKSAHDRLREFVS